MPIRVLHEIRKVWRYNKNVGKSGYKSNEVRQTSEKKKFNGSFSSSSSSNSSSSSSCYDAEAADVWTLGVILFLLVFQKYPFERRADANDPFYHEAVLCGAFRQWLDRNKLTHWVTESCFDLINRILRPEEYRITVPELLEHPFKLFES